MNELSKKQNHPAPESTEEDYKLIEEALLQNPRGRWFLEEFLNRNRPEDTRKLLDAMQRIENSLEVKKAQPDEGLDPIRMSIIEMSKAIAKTREEIKSIKPENDEDNQLLNASEELSAIVESTESATNTILEAAEEIQEAAWILREAGSDDGPCDIIDNKTTDIYTACSFQDITGQRTTKVVQALCYIENRVNAMIDIWGLNDAASGGDQPIQQPTNDPRADAHLLNGPAKRGEGLEQGSIDDMLNSEAESTAHDDGQSLADSLSFDSIDDSPAAQVDLDPDDFSFDPIDPDLSADFETSADQDDSALTASPAAELAEDAADFIDQAETFIEEASTREIAPDHYAEADATPGTLTAEETSDPVKQESKLDYITRRCSTQSAAMAATLISDIQFAEEQEDISDLAQLAEGALSDAPLTTLPEETDDEEEELQLAEAIEDEKSQDPDIETPVIKSLNPALAESAELAGLDAEEENILDQKTAAELEELSAERLTPTQEEALLS